MSEKTLGEVAYEAALPYMIKAGGMTDSAFQAAADAIAAPLLARIAEMEREVERRKAMACSTCDGVGELTVFSGQTPESYQEDTVECPDCVGIIKEEAYQSGVAEERERCAHLADQHGATLGCIIAADIRKEPTP